MHAEITVLAGGYSAKPFVGALTGFVIGVNDSALLARCDAAISMDRLWSEHRWPQLKALGMPTWLRSAAAKNIATRPPWLTVFDCDHTSIEFSDESGRLNGTHSGFVALNLAYQMRPQRLTLVGFDMARGPRGEAHWHPPYDWAPQGATTTGKFNAWAAQFESAARRFREAGIEVTVKGATAIPAFRVTA